MARKLTVAVNWQGKLDFTGLIERAKIADAAGIHSIWVAEAWGRDAFTLLTILAEHTKKIQLATSIVNIYSRTPAALAQHFGTLDELSDGRVIIGLGTSGPQVIEHFHGVKFNPPLTRMKECVEIINLLIAGTPLKYQGRLFKLSRGFTLRFEPVRKHIPVWIASLNPKSVEFTARQADGWLPVMIPLSGLKRAIDDFRAVARAAGRAPTAVEVKAPGHVTVTNNPERALAGHAGTVAFYAARMGTLLRRATHPLRVWRRRRESQGSLEQGRCQRRNRGALGKTFERAWLHRRYRGSGRAPEGPGPGGRRFASGGNRRLKPR